MLKMYEFWHTNSGEVVLFARIKGEYRIQNEGSHWEHNTRLYPYLKITSLKQLVLELLELGFYLVDIH